MHNENRMDTISMDVNSKEMLIRQNHPVIREIRRISEILFEEEAVTGEQSVISLKELFRKENMDRYHVDCLVLCKIARNMLQIQKELSERKIYPGLYDLEDVYVDFDSSNYRVYLTHPERFQLLSLEQDYEWYPEDERLLGDVVLFDAEAQAKADQRFLYKILVASSKGNVKVPPRTNGQDYSTLFYGTLPEDWKELFSSDRILSLAEWQRNLEEMIASEEHFEKMVREDNQKKEENFIDGRKEEFVTATTFSAKRKTLYVILRSECRNSLEMSRMMYELQDRFEEEERRGRFRQEQGFLYGDGVILKKDFAEYFPGYRVQIPQTVAEYSTVEALFLGCEWMKESDAHAMMILADGKIENNSMFKECLKRLKRLKEEGHEICLFLGKDASCEGWEKLSAMLQSV
ncbi:MAG: hypothetical protein Q4E53_02910 [Eubacteriales bacterium]|nr:hypothetical protein [Eubacteriales bacterium]